MGARVANTSSSQTDRSAIRQPPTRRRASPFHIGLVTAAGAGRRDAMAFSAVRCSPSCAPG